MSNLHNYAATINFDGPRPDDWKQLQGIGTAYIDGELQWCALWGGKLWNDEHPKGAKFYHAFVRMDWCDPKDVQIARNVGARRHGAKTWGKNV